MVSRTSGSGSFCSPKDRGLTRDLWTPALTLANQAPNATKAVGTLYCDTYSGNTSMMFSWDDVSVNGYMVDPFWATSVPAGCKKITTISFSSSKFEENGIEKVEEIEFELRVYDNDNWMAKDFVKDTFTYKPAQ